MKKRIDSLRRLGSALFLITIIGGFSAGEAAAQHIVVDFNDSVGLLAIPGDCSRAALCSGAPMTFANFYREKGMIFTDGVNPPDPALGGIRNNHYHLNYEDENITYGFVQGKLTPGRQTPGGFVPVANPENENRTLSPHEPGAVIQMIYDPNNDGVPDPFNLISLVVHRGKLNVGTKSATGRICVYNDLTGGFEWGLTGDCAINLTRATLEVPVAFGGEGIFTVDRIVFEPASSRIGTTTSPLVLTETNSIEEGKANPVELDNVLHDIRDPLLFELIDLAAPAFATLDIKKALVKLRGPAQDQFQMRGTIDLGAQSDGVDVLNEAVIVTLAGFREYIPAGLFRCIDRECDFNGTSGGITNMRIAIAEDKLQFRVTAEGLDLSGIRRGKPVPFSLQIGDDLGVTQVRVRVDPE